MILSFSLVLTYSSQELPDGFLPPFLYVQAPLFCIVPRFLVALPLPLLSHDHRIVTLLLCV